MRDQETEAGGQPNFVRVIPQRHGDGGAVGNSAEQRSQLGVEPRN